MKKISVTGPESTGKSELSIALASHFKTTRTKEFARDYIRGLNRPYQQDDLLLIAKEQLKMEEEKKKVAHRFLFCDSDLLVIKIWSLHKYGVCHPWILNQLEKNRYDLYMLCDIDLPWQYDPQREHPHLRRFFFNWYKKELEDYGFPYFVVSGKGKQRIENALTGIRQYFTSKTG